MGSEGKHKEKLSVNV